VQQKLINQTKTAVDDRSRLV